MIGKKFKSGFVNNQIIWWEVRYPVKNLPHHEQRFVCVSLNLKEEIAMTLPINKLWYR